MDRNTIDNIHAFTKLYGYARMFHPSDEAATIDWDRFAIFGLQKVAGASDAAELRRILLDLFLPVAPSIEIYQTINGLKYDLRKIVPDDPTDLTIVAWQRLGMSLNENQKFDIYKKARLGRLRIPEIKYTEISRKIDAAKFKGKKLIAKGVFCIDTDFEGYEASFFLDIFRKNGIRPERKELSLNSDTYKEYILEAQLPDDTSSLKIGCKQTAEGIFFMSGIKLEFINAADGKNEDTYIWDFEDHELNRQPAWWDLINESAIVEVIDYNSYKGTKCCMIASYFEKQLFDKYPLPGELIQKEISQELSCVVPLSLYADDTGTLPCADTLMLDKLNNGLSGIDLDSLTHEDLYARLAGIVILWNVVQHSYPYFDLYEIDWENALDIAIESAHKCKSEIEYVNSLNLLMANLNDGHCRVEYDGDDKVLFSPPFALTYAEGSYVISRVIGNDSQFHLGDVITTVNEKPINEAAEDVSKYISSATEGFRTLLISGKLTKGKENSKIQVGLLRENKVFTVETNRYLSYSQLMASRFEAGKSLDAIHELKQGIYYIDLSRAKLTDIEEMAKTLAEAKGIVFDVRSYPKLNFCFLGYLNNEPMLSQMWNVPQIIYPDHEDFAGYNTDGRWTITPLEPRFKGKNVFLTGPGAISYGESLMGIVEAYKLGEIVGEATAGTNGDINPVKLPGGYTAFYTGMKVLKHDGSRHHGVGIKPTIYCPRTIKGIAEGRDEQLEKAIEIIELFSN